MRKLGNFCGPLLTVCTVGVFNNVVIKDCHLDAINYDLIS